MILISLSSPFYHSLSSTNEILVIVGVISSVHSLSRVQLFVTPWTAVHLASLSITNSQSLLSFLFLIFQVRDWNIAWIFSLFSNVCIECFKLLFQQYFSVFQKL